MAPVARRGAVRLPILMRLYVHDYAGHPFQVELSRALAARGHEVRHGYSATNLTPQGRMARTDDDPPTFEPDPIRTAPVDKRARSLAGLVARQRAERAYGHDAADRIADFRPDVVLCANTPLDSLGPIQATARGVGAGFVNWLQDALSVGMRALLARKLPVAGDLVGRMYEAREGRLLRSADAVVAITEDFRPLLHRWRVQDTNVHVIENWATLADLPVRPQDNAWSRAHSLAGRTCVVYAGTLGMKHDPALLARLADVLGARDPEARVVVASEGAGADWLREEKARRSLDALCLLPFQAFDTFSDLLGAAAVNVAVLEPEAGVMSVPSKVLSYLCADRPIVLSVPPENLAARIVAREGAGLVAPPGDAGAFVDAVIALLDDDGRRRAMGAAGRAYAERAFDLGAITNRFEAVLADAAGRRR